MTRKFPDISIRKAARIAGFGYLIIIIAGIFAEFFVRSKLIVFDNAAETVTNIIAYQGLFRISIASDLIMLAFDIIVAMALYILLMQVNKGLALLATFFRLVHSAVYGITLLNLAFVLILIKSPDYLTAFGADQLNSIIMMFLEGHSYGYLLGLIFFGFHCLVLGYLIIKSGYIPKILGILILFAAGGYLIDSFAHILMVNYNDYASIFMMIVAVPAIVGELSLSLWLIFRGNKIPE